LFQSPRVVDYRASVHDIAGYLTDLMLDAALRRRLGEAGRKRAVADYHYQVVARRSVRTVSARFEIS
jgi:hypothetical protein